MRCIPGFAPVVAPPLKNTRKADDQTARPLVDYDLDRFAMKNVTAAPKIARPSAPPATIINLS